MHDSMAQLWISASYLLKSELAQRSVNWLPLTELKILKVQVVQVCMV